MMCPQCGPNPSAVIWDGVSISFSQKMALPSLKPPTTIHPESMVYDKTVRVKETQCIPDRGLRKRMREILTGPSLAGGLTPDKDQEESGSGSDAEQVRGARAEALAKKKEGLKKRFQLIPKVVEDLSTLDHALGGLFQDYFGMEAVLKKVDVPHEYKELFFQVLNHMVVLRNHFLIIAGILSTDCGRGKRSSNDERPRIDPSQTVHLVPKLSYGVETHSHPNCLQYHPI